MYLNVMFLDEFLFELSCKNTHGNTHENTETWKHTHARTQTQTLTSSTIIKYYVILCRIPMYTNFQYKPPVSLTS